MHVNYKSSDYKRLNMIIVLNLYDYINTCKQVSTFFFFQVNFVENEAYVRTETQINLDAM